MPSSTVPCFHCGLFLPKSPYIAESAGESRSFCCYGCYLVHGLTGEDGEQGAVRWLYYRLGIAVFLTINIMMFEMALYSEYFYPSAGAEQFHSLLRYLLLALSTPVLVLLGFPLISSSLQGLRLVGLNMDFLIAIGALSAYLVSLVSTLREKGQVYFETMAMVLVLVTLGRYLEAQAKVKATSDIKGLLEQNPESCTRVKDGGEEIIAPSEVQEGDVLKFKPGGVFCVDGVVLSGEGSADESLLTGESKAVFKGPNSPIYSGTTNSDGTLLVRATEVGEKKMLRRLARLLEEARSLKAPIERLADRISGFAIPAIISVSVGTLAYWWRKTGLESGILNALAVLLIACPCALGIATPMAIWVALGRAAKHGILIRRAEVLEQLAEIRAALFDKTGTLTDRSLTVSVVFVRPDGRTDPLDVLRTAASLEAESEHPLAGSLVAHAQRAGCTLAGVEQFQYLPGLGVRGRIQQKSGSPESFALREVALGSRRFFQRLNVPLTEPFAHESTRLEQTGATVVLCGWNESTSAPLECIGLIAFEEKPRDGAADCLQALRQAGIHIAVLTGDSTDSGGAFQEKMAVEVRAGLLPEEKLIEIRKTRTRYGPTLYAGDGVNDAPALQAADVGVALGCGSDLTREAADVSLLGNDLEQIPWLLHLAKRTRRTIRVNLFWAFSYNSLGIILAAAGMLHPVLAAGAMVLSSSFVARNSMRLGR